MRALRNAIIVLAVTLAVYVVVDLGFGLFQHYQNHLFPPDPNAVPGHRGQPYATSDFIVEALELGAVMTIPGTNLLEPQEVHGRYYNVDRLAPTGLFYRRTLNPAEDQRPTVTVLFIGGSNVYGAEVPDDMTIPSQLSQRLNQLDPTHRYLVVNAGVTGADSVLEKGRLDYELAHGQKPDIVLVMDGGLDVMEGIYMGIPRRPQAAGRSQPVEWFYRYVPLNIYRALRAWGAAHAVALGLKHPAGPAPGSGAAEAADRRHHGVSIWRMRPPWRRSPAKPMRASSPSSSPIGMPLISKQKPMTSPMWTRACRRICRGSRNRCRGS